MSYISIQNCASGQTQGTLLSWKGEINAVKLDRLPNESATKNALMIRSNVRVRHNGKVVGHEIMMLSSLSCCILILATEMRFILCRSCKAGPRQGQAEQLSKSKKKFHQTTYKE